MSTTFMNTFCEAFAHAQVKPGVVPHPLWNVLALFNYLVFKLRKCDWWVRFNHVSASLEIPWGCQSEIDWDLKGQSRGYDMASLQTVPCHIAGIVLLEERDVSNSLILQDMWVKDFIYIALVCKWPLYYYAIKRTLYKAHGGLLNLSMSYILILIILSICQKCFTDGDLLQEPTLLEVAQECGLDKEQANSYIQDKEHLEKVFEKAMSWAERGISG